MKLVMTLLVRDEADILDAQIAFHLRAGVDFIIAIDHRSQDGTTKILERYMRDGRLHLIREESEMLLQGQWRDELAQRAAVEFGADWVISSDADEFWWPRGGDLKEVLAAVPRRFGVIGCLWRNFPYRPGSGFFAERMTTRLSLRAPLNDEAGPYHVNMKVAFRADPDVELQNGQHDVARHTGPRLREWYPIEVLHFPVRSREQCERKFATKGVGREKAAAAGRADRPLSQHTAAGHKAIREGRLDDWLALWTVDDDVLARGTGDGWLAEDTRLRDALRGLSEVSRDALVFPPAAPVDAAYIDDACRLTEGDAIVRTAQRLDGLERRIAVLDAELSMPTLSRRKRVGV